MSVYIISVNYKILIKNWRKKMGVGVEEFFYLNFHVEDGQGVDFIVC